MRLDSSQVKEAILNPDQEVRNAAIYYFARSFSTDQELMPLVLRAVEHYGRKESFFAYSFLESLPQCEDSIRWLIQQIETLEESDVEEEARFRQHLLEGLTNADPRLLQRHQAEIDAMAMLDKTTREVIDQQLQFALLEPQILWQQMEDFCRSSDGKEYVSDDDDKYANHIAKAVGRYVDRFSEQVLSVLCGDTEDFGNWMEGMAVKLAGEMKLDAAVPYLVEMLGEDDDEWLHEECTRALRKIGTESVVRHLAAADAQDNWYQRLAVAAILEDIHTDVSVQTCLELLSKEEDVFLRGHLIQSILMNFSTEGIEPARSHVVNTPLDPDVLEVRCDLLTASKMMGVSLPEFDEWLKESKNDVEFRKKWYAEHRLTSDLDKGVQVDGVYEYADDDEALLPITTILRREARVGRNEPCPCGSGKKFKNCCIRSLPR